MPAEARARVDDDGGSGTVRHVVASVQRRGPSTATGEEHMSGRQAFVVTGAARGVGRAIAERLAVEGEVVVVDVADELGWQHERVHLVTGDARDPDVAARAAAQAEAAGPLVGWVNNAAIFRDAGFASATAVEVMEIIVANLALAVTGCHAAVSHFMSHGRAGAIVNVSSHQAQRPVRGALPYATAKAAV